MSQAYDNSTYALVCECTVRIHRYEAERLRYAIRQSLRLARNEACAQSLLRSLGLYQPRAAVALFRLGLQLLEGWPWPQPGAAFGGGRSRGSRSVPSCS